MQFDAVLLCQIPIRFELKDVTFQGSRSGINFTYSLQQSWTFCINLNFMKPIIFVPLILLLLGNLASAECNIPLDLGGLHNDAMRHTGGAKDGAALSAVFGQ